MILSVNGLWEYSYIFQWIPMFLFILVFLCFTGITGKTFYKHYGSARNNLLLVVPRCRQVVNTFAQSGTYMTALKEQKVSPIFAEIDFPLGEFGLNWEETITNLSSQDVQCQKSNRQALEDQWSNSDTSAKIECDRNYIFKLVDEISEFAHQRMFPELVSCIDEAIQKIEDFHNEYSASIARDEQHVDIFQVLGQAQVIFKKSLDNLEYAIGWLNGGIKEPGKQKHRLEKAAEMCEVVAFEFKDHARFLSIEVLSRLFGSIETVRNLYAADLAENAERQDESQYKSKRRIWVASCTIRASIMDVIQESSQDFGVFESKEEARSVMNVSSESEYRNFLSELDDDW